MSDSSESEEETPQKKQKMDKAKDRAFKKEIKDLKK